jgi:hypothetical protein
VYHRMRRQCQNSRAACRATVRERLYGLAIAAVAL